MKHLLSYSLCLFFLVFSSCKQEPAQSAPINVEAEIDDEQLLLGPIDREAFKLPNYQIWYDSTYQAYKVKTEYLPAIEAGLEDVEIKAFVATWCSDTQEQIPAFSKILDRLEFNEENLSMVALDRNMDAPNDPQAGYDIEYVPTLIFSRGEHEIGRIVEAPDRSLEEDLLSILDR